MATSEFYMAPFTLNKPMQRTTNINQLTSNKIPVEVVSVRIQNGDFNFQLCGFTTNILQADK